ncbi:MAG: aminotransferase class III-fold pyridoxal phosphate-dependent enzyme [Deltaproteobacteria bacterium]|nr:aminotransferase class III-fold pyridoxal phosphate-dependent enzyme [Deltaproteobacteria bacterium]
MTSAPLTVDAPFLDTYARFPLELVRGAGRRVQDSSGRWYLDAIGGIAVLALGHDHPEVKAAIHAQVDTLLHTSNLYRLPVQRAFANKLLEMLGGAAVFLCNTGAEANEGAVKLIRKHHWRQAGCPGDGNSPRTEIIVLDHAFHGRTMMALAMTPKPAYHQGFGPLPDCVKVVPAEQVAAAVSERTAAVFLEPVQGEGGCRPVPGLQAIREACDKHGALLVFDEIQCGLGRTGELIHHPRPDIITLAKAIGGGLPLGAILVVNPALTQALQPGDHGTTFGGNPVACAAGLATLQIIERDDLPARCAALGARLRAGLEAAGAEVSGLGLIQAARFGLPIGPVVARMRENGVLVVGAGADAIRFLPAFNSTEDEIDEMVAVFAKSLAEVKAGQG